MVGEGVVLLRVEDFEQGRGRIAPVVGADFVDLVHHEDRVAGARAFQSLQDAARHCANVSAAVATNLSLVAHSAKRKTVELAAHRPRHSLAQRSLAHARRADKAEDRPFGLRVQLAHCKKFKDALLDLLQAEVIFIQHCRRFDQVKQISRGLLPRQVNNPLNVGADDVGLGGIRVHHLQPLQFLEGLFACVLGQLLFGDLLLQLLNVLGVGVVVAQLFFQSLHLLAQIVLPLRFRHLLPRVRLNLGLHRRHFQLFVEQIGNQAQPLQRINCLQYLLRLAHLEAEVGADQISQPARLLDAVDDSHQIGGKCAAQRHDLLSLLAHQTHQRLNLHGDLSPGLIFLNQGDADAEMRLLLFVVGDAGFGQSLHQHLQPAVRQLECAHNLHNHAHLIQIVRLRLVAGDLFLGDKHHHLAAAHGLVHSGDGTGPSDKERQDHVVEDHHIPHRHHRQLFGNVGVLNAVRKIVHAAGQ